jgi:hypothetical protein
MSESGHYLAIPAWPPEGVEAAMHRFVHNANIAHYRKLIAESEIDPSRDEKRHKMLLTLLAEEMAKDAKANDQRPLDS